MYPYLKIKSFFPKSIDPRRYWGYFLNRTFSKPQIGLVLNLRLKGERMALLEILTYPNPILKKKAEPINEIDSQIRALAHDMAQTMYAAPGIGLAAPQVGQSVRLVVLDLQSEEEGSRLYTLINPEIIEKDGKIIGEEGCLSVPDIREEVTRFEFVTVNALNLDGEKIVIKAQGLFAVALQHEIDHLDGILFVDHLSKLKQSLLKKRLKKEAEEKAG